MENENNKFENQEKDSHYDQQTSCKKASTGESGYLFGDAAEKSAAIEKSSCVRGAWFRAVSLVLILCVAFVGAFSGMAYLCQSAIFSDSELFDGFLAKWAGVVENRAEVDVISGSYEGDTIALAEKVLNTTVRIRVVSESEKEGITEISSGSGVIYSKTESGTYLIVTNHHVIDTAKKFYVETYSGQRFEGKVMYSDERSDVAIVTIQPDSELPVAVQGVSANLKFGQRIIVAGNPLGNGLSVSFGYISNPYRVTTANNNVPLITLDCSINPGNSGGGVYDEAGNFVGLVVSKASGSDIDGIGYAVPIDTVNEVINDLLTYGYVRGRPAIGITVVTLYSNEAYEYYKNGILAGYLPETNKPHYGIYITESENPILKKGDRLVSVDGKGISVFADISEALLDRVPGNAIEIIVERALVVDGELIDDYDRVTLTVLLIESR